MSEILSKDEKVVLIAVMKYIVSTDGVITEREIDDINDLAEDAGFVDFQKIFEEVDNTIKSMDDLKALIDQVKNETSRLRIIRYALEFSRADAEINPHENEILKYMSSKWKISLKKMIDEE
jgi:uncharacterized tellurite resistance protein B-like protein